VLAHTHGYVVVRRRLASESTSARKLIENLDQAILAKAFRGELVPQNPNDQPASVSLRVSERKDKNGLRVVADTDRHVPLRVGLYLACWTWSCLGPFGLRLLARPVTAV
jgi:hypothetical protein